MIEFILMNPLSEGYSIEELIDYLEQTEFELESLDTQNSIEDIKLFYIFDGEKKEVGKISIEGILRSTPNGIERIVRCIINISDSNVDKLKKIQSNFSIDIENLKVCLKEYFTKKGRLNHREKYFEKCIWLSDIQSCLISTELSGKLYDLENKLRSIIEEIFSVKIGYNWAIEHAKIYTSGRDVGDYKKKVEKFKDIDMLMNNLLTNEVIDLITNNNISLSSNVDNITIVKQELNKLLVEIFEINQKTSDAKLRENIKNSSLFDKESQSLFDRYFNEYSQSGNRNLKNQWDDVTKRRNHIAHNKPLDIFFYEETILIFSKVDKILVEIIENFREQNITERFIFTKDWINKQSYLELQDYIIDEKQKYIEVEEQIAERESGVSVLNENEIIELFRENINTKIDELFEILNNNNFDIIENNNFDDKTILLNGEYILNRDLSIVISSDIRIVDDSPGSTSEVSVTFNIDSLDGSEEYTENISFINSEYYFNEEQANYMPVIDSEIQILGFQKKVDEIISDIDKKFPSLLEKAKQKYSSYDFVKDGGQSQLISEECPFCGEWDTICIDPEFFDLLSKSWSNNLGLCLNCGEECEVGENAQGYIKVGEVGDDLWLVDLFE